MTITSQKKIEGKALRTCDMTEIILFVCVVILLIAFVAVTSKPKREMNQKDMYEESLKYLLNHEGNDIRSAFEAGYLCRDEKESSLDEFQSACMKTSKYHEDELLVCATLGLNEEAGEVAGKVNKWIRKNHNTEMDDEMKHNVAMELFDVMWNVSAAATSIGYPLSDIACMGIEKLADRERRNQIDNINGGDNR